MFFDEDVLIGAEYQKDLVKDYSIKFMLMPMFDIEMSVIPQFTGVKNRIFYKKMPKFKNIQYEKFKRLKLDFPKRIQMDKVYEKVKGNKRDLHLFNSRYKAIKIKHKVNDYNKRKKRVLRKKERLYNETNTRNRENLNRNQKLKEEVKIYRIYSLENCCVLESIEEMDEIFKTKFLDKNYFLYQSCGKAQRRLFSKQKIIKSF